MQQQFMFFVLRWLLNSLGLWIATLLLTGHGVNYDPASGVAMFLFAGFMLSIVNVLLKPLVTILSLPAILLTLGLFTLVVNGFMVWLATKLVPGLEMSFLAAIVTGMIISLINYLITSTTVKGDKK